MNTSFSPREKHIRETIGASICYQEHRGGFLAWLQRKPSEKKFFSLEEKYSGPSDNIRANPLTIASEEKNESINIFIFSERNDGKEKIFIFSL